MITRDEDQCLNGKYALQKTIIRGEGALNVLATPYKGNPSTLGDGLYLG